MTDFRKAIIDRILILDGAMGTSLQGRGLAPAGCVEEMNRLAPDLVIGVHAGHVEAGVDILAANSFGGNRVKLAGFNLDDAVDELNRRAVELARQAAPAGIFVGGSVGPTGRFLEPAGDAGFDEMVAIFAEQISSLAAAGADLICFEKFTDIRELRAGVIACRDVCDLPIIARMLFDAAGPTVPVTSPAAAAVTLDALGVDVIGTGCGPGFEAGHGILAAMRQVTPRPLIAPANVVSPILGDGQPFTPGTPEEMSARYERLVALGVRVVGGCSGMAPTHVRAMRATFNNGARDWTPPARRGHLSSRSAVVEFGGNAPCALIGERINPTGKKVYSEELRSGETAYIRHEAAAQVAAGADLLDVNCGDPDVDEAAALERAIYAVSSVSSVPLVIDTADPVALEAALKAVDGKVLINSVNGAAGSLARVLPLARRYGAALIGLTLDEQGIPDTAEGRVAIAGRIRDAVLAAGLPEQDLVIDCLALTVSAGQKQALETLRTVRLVRDRLGLATALGVSNISFGLPCRPIISSVFFAMALEAGLNLAIVNPKDRRIMDAYRSAMVLLGHDRMAENYIADYARAAIDARSGVE